MGIWFPALINGIFAGALYGLFAMGFVVLYRMAGIVHLGQGNMAMFLTFIGYALMVAFGLPVWVVLIAAMAIGVILGLVVHVIFMAPLRRRGLLNPLIRTLALLLLFFAIAELVWGPGEPYRFPPLIDGGFFVAGYRVVWIQVLGLIISIAVAFAFRAFLTQTDWGLRIRAVASDRETASLIGIRALVVEGVGWGVIGLFCGVVGVLFAPLTELSAIMMEGFLIKAFLAAIIGGLTSFMGPLVGGLLIGVITSELTVYFVPEWANISMLLFMVVVLLVRPAGIFGHEEIRRA